GQVLCCGGIVCGYSFLGTLPSSPLASVTRLLTVWKVSSNTQLPMSSQILFGHISVKGFNSITANGLLHFALLFFAGDNTLPCSETVSQWITHQVVIPE